MVVIAEEAMQYDARMTAGLHSYEASSTTTPSCHTETFPTTDDLMRPSVISRRGRSSSTRAAASSTQGNGSSDFFSRLRQYSVERKGKMVKFFRNGDQFFPGTALCISLDRYRCIGGLYEELNRVLGVSEYLDRGVRRLLSLEGKLLQSVEEVLEAGAAICSSNDALRKLDYAGIQACPQWKFSPSQMDAKRKDLRQRHGGGMSKRQTVRAEKVISPKRIIVFLHESSMSQQQQQRPRKHLKLLLNEQTVNGGYQNFLRQVQQQFNTKYQLPFIPSVEERNSSVSNSTNNNNINTTVTNDAVEKKSADFANNSLHTTSTTTTMSIRIFACFTPAGKRCAALLDLVRGGDENNCFIAFDERCNSVSVIGDDSSSSSDGAPKLSDDDFIIAYADALALDADEMQILQEHTLTAPFVAVAKTAATPPNFAAVQQSTEQNAQQLFKSPLIDGEQNQQQQMTGGNSIVGRCLAQARKQIAGTCNGRKRIAPVVVAHHAVAHAAAAAAAARRPRSAQANFGAGTAVSSSVSSPTNIAEVLDSAGQQKQDDFTRAVASRKAGLKTGQTTLHTPPQQACLHLSFKPPSQQQSAASRKISAPAASSAGAWKNDRHQLAHPSTIAATAGSRQFSSNNNCAQTLADAPNGRATPTGSKRPTTCAVAAVAGAARRLVHRTRAVSNNPSISNKQRQQISSKNTPPINNSSSPQGQAVALTPTNTNNNLSNPAITMPHPTALTSKYRVMGQIGTGNFADVHLCADVYDLSRQYALKIIDKRKVLDKRNLSNECALLRKLGMHPNIVTLYEQYEFSNRVYLLMELVAGGDLFNYISQAKCLSERESATLITTLINGLHYLHKHGIVHRDVKPENLLVCCQPVAGGGENCAYAAKSLKLCDFGLAVELPAPGQRLFTICGSPTYIAPEILHETGYDYQVDVWATGVITYIMLAGYPPFRGDEETGQEELFGQILDARYCFDDEYWCNVSPLAKDLISRILVVNPYRRLTCTEIFAHEWIQNYLQFVPHPLSDSLLSSLSKINLFKSAALPSSSNSCTSLSSSAAAAAAAAHQHRVRFLPDVFPGVANHLHANSRSRLKLNGAAATIVTGDKENVVPNNNAATVSGAKINYAVRRSVPDIISTTAFAEEQEEPDFDAADDEFSSAEAALLCATPTSRNVAQLQQNMFAFGDASGHNNLLFQSNADAEGVESTMDDEQLIF